MDEWSDLIENYEIGKEKERKEARKQRNKEKKQQNQAKKQQQKGSANKTDSTPNEQKSYWDWFQDKVWN